MGSGSHAHHKRAIPLGKWLGSLDVHLLTGGGQGVMEAVSRAFYHVQNRKGLVLGIIPCRENQLLTTPPGYPNQWVELPIFTHLPYSGDRGTNPLSRNHINILSATIVIALPGGTGTVSEVKLAKRYGRPVAAFLDEEDCRKMHDLPKDLFITDDLEHMKNWIKEKVGSHRQSKGPLPTGGS